MPGSLSGNSDAATTDSDLSTKIVHSRRRKSSASNTVRSQRSRSLPEEETLTVDRVRAHSRSYVGTSQPSLPEEDEEDSGGESADVFGDLGANYLPWRRPSLSSQEGKPVKREVVEPLAGDDLSDLKKNVYDNHSAREELLQTSYNEARYYLTETYLDAELSRFELLMKEMMSSSVLKSIDEIDIKLKTTPWDESADGALNVEAAKDQKISAVKTTWLLKTLKASEDFNMKTKLVRGMFRRTNTFFDELNAMEFSFLTKKHLRELAKKRMLQKLRHTSDATRQMRSSLDAVELVHQRNLQHCEVRNLKELYIRMLQKEWGGLDSHLTMLETLYKTLHGIYIDVMNLKIRGVNEWCIFRGRHDANTRDVIRHIREQCVSEFREYKESDRLSEMNVVKQQAEEDRAKRKLVFGDSAVVLSSELVFNMNVSARNKNLYVLDDTSSVGTFDLEDDDVDVIETENASSSSHNADFLHLIKLRMARKKHLETKYNAMLDNEITSRQKAEVTYCENTRRHEREYLKTAMKRYFSEEAHLAEQIQEFLRHEKHAVDALKARQAAEVENLTTAQEIEVTRLETEFDDKQSGAAAQPSVPISSDNDDVMLTAHCFHELRNVLASILCLGENLREDPASIDSIVQEQSDVCSYALDTINDMLSVAKLKDSNYKCTRTSMSVSELFDAVIRLQGRRALKGVQVIKIVDDASLCILSDKKLLLQLFVNLLSNAAKFTKEGTIALVAVRTGQADATTNTVRLGIVDTGCGIQNMPGSGARDLSNVQTFADTKSEISATVSDYQSSGYRVRNTGYGLYLASTVANTLGTKLKVHSPVLPSMGMPVEPDCPGSFFYLKQPEQCGFVVARNQEIEEEVQDLRSRQVSYAAPTKDDWQFAPAGTMRVLVVDDQKLLRQTMILTLKKLCELHPKLVLQLETACCAEEALRKHTSTPFHFITVDQYYDQMQLSCIEQCTSDEYPALLMQSSDAEGNRTRYIEFKKQEAFHITADDGVLLGTDILLKLRSIGNPVVFICTGSDDVPRPVLDKPYTVAKLVKLMNQQMQSFLTHGAVILCGNHLKNHDDLILYEMLQ